MRKRVFKIFAILAGLLISVSNTTAHPSWAIAVDGKNQIYVSDLAKIWKIDAAGNVSVISERHTHELRIDAADNLFGEELHYEPATQKYTSAIWRITPNGEFSYLQPPTETMPKGLSIWKNQAGDTFYSGQTDDASKEFYLLKRSADGNVKVLFGDERRAVGRRQIVPYSYGGMVFAPDDSLYFKNSDTIWKLAADDKISVIVAKDDLSKITPDPMLFGLSLDAENNLYTADFKGKRILKIATDKSVLIAYTSETGWSPTGVFARDENIYVLENKDVPPNPNVILRVRKIAPAGNISTIAVIGENSENVANNSRSNQNVNVQNQPDEQKNKTCALIPLLFIACFFAANKKRNGWAAQRLKRCV